MALIVTRVRVGRWARLATTILFIIGRAKQILREYKRESNARGCLLSSACYRLPASTPALALLLRPDRHYQAGLRAVQMHHLRSRRLLQHKLVVLQRRVDVHLEHVQRDVVLFLRAVNLDSRWKTDPGKIL